MAVVTVKAGENVGVAMIRDLRGAMERTGAEIGIFLTLTPPRGGMQAEAAAAGQHEEPGFAPVPRIQIVTIEEAMALRDRAAQIPARARLRPEGRAQAEGRAAGAACSSPAPPPAPARTSPAGSGGSPGARRGSRGPSAQSHAVARVRSASSLPPTPAAARLRPAVRAARRQSATGPVPSPSGPQGKGSTLSSVP